MDGLNKVKPPASRKIGEQGWQLSTGPLGRVPLCQARFIPDAELGFGVGDMEHSGSIGETREKLLGKRRFTASTFLAR